MRYCTLLLAVVLAGTAAPLSAGDLTKHYASPRLDSLALTLSQKKGDPTVALSMLTPDGRDEGGNNKARDFGKIQAGGAKQFEAAPIVTGVLIDTDASQLELFVGMKPPPQYVAFVAGRKVVVQPATDKIPLHQLDEPWLLCWWGDKTPHAKFASAQEARREFDFPFLIVLQNPAIGAAVLADRLTLNFPAKAGSVVVMPLRGQLSVPAEKGQDSKGQAAYLTTTRRWSSNLPDEVAAQARAWTTRMRSIPTEVSTMYEIVGDGVKITEKFQHRKIDDSWKTPGQPWALLPPPIAFARMMKGPVTAPEPVKDLPWLGSCGTLSVADGTDTVSCTLKIPRLQEYLFREADKPGDSNIPRVRQLREELTREIDKLLAAREAPQVDVKAKSTASQPSASKSLQVLAQAVPLLPKEKAEPLANYLKAKAPAASVLKDSKGRVECVYAAWVWMKHVAGEAEAKALWPQVQQVMAQELTGYPWSQVERPEPNDGVSIGNTGLGGINGYIALARFARLAGDKDAEELATCLCARAMVLKYALAYYFQYLIDQDLETGVTHLFPPKFFGPGERIKGTELAVHRDGAWYLGNGTYNGTFRARVRYAYLMDLAPESAQFLRDYCREPIEVAVRYSYWKYPGQWQSRVPGFHRFGEHLLEHPQYPWAGFMARALVLEESPDELYWITGDPYREVGDLYFIQRLCMTLRAYALAARP